MTAGRGPHRRPPPDQTQSFDHGADFRREGCRMKAALSVLAGLEIGPALHRLALGMAWKGSHPGLGKRRLMTIYMLQPK